MKQDNMALENFINFCGKMQIAEEGLFSRLLGKNKKAKPQATAHRRKAVKKVVNRGGKTLKVETLYQDKFDDHPSYPTLSPESKRLIDQKLMPVYNKMLNEIKTLMNSINKEFNLTDYKFTAVDISKQCNLMYTEKETLCQLGVGSFPFGFKDIYKIYNKKEEGDIVNKAFSKFEEGVEKIISKYPGARFSVCKHNTDYPPCCDVWDRWFYWIEYTVEVDK